MVGKAPKCLTFSISFGFRSTCKPGYTTYGSSHEQINFNNVLIYSFIQVYFRRFIVAAL